MFYCLFFDYFSVIRFFFYCQRLQYKRDLMWNFCRINCYKFDWTCISWDFIQLYKLYYICILESKSLHERQTGMWDTCQLRTKREYPHNQWENCICCDHLRCPSYISSLSMFEGSNLEPSSSTIYKADNFSEAVKKNLSVSPVINCFTVSTVFTHQNQSLINLCSLIWCLFCTNLSAR